MVLYIVTCTCHILAGSYHLVGLLQSSVQLRVKETIHSLPYLDPKEIMGNFGLRNELLNTRLSLGSTCMISMYTVCMKTLLAYCTVGNETKQNKTKWNEMKWNEMGNLYFVELENLYFAKW